MGASPRAPPAVVVLFDAEEEEVRLHVEASVRGIEQGVLGIPFVSCEVIPLVFVDDHVSMENTRWRSILTADALIFVSAALPGGPSPRMQRFLGNTHFSWEEAAARLPLVGAVFVCPPSAAAHGTIPAQHAVQLWAAAHDMRWLFGAGVIAGTLDLGAWRGACVGLGGCMGSTAAGPRAWD